ncbi:sigma-70 family RNA polymerase sigma factor [Marinicella sp. S1101]|uniref:sigma-70 family RNA polymerase sigma factor n=1 Tax=Marinicella marina TaxID=2996016 RepID=UPI002260B358|nr:sigma-70 family RNA polymerase sigma factor [Marinicella marina]MCX7552927.1 sigma-70 family RNA polymerase sigma factor [Marinicella marina]MDJ1139764.1 sigma-70 family RNA polymerase sigma factor [Marinicella marina]
MFDIYLCHEQSSEPHNKNVAAEAHELNQQLDDFLREQQKQAFAIALVSVKQESDALDVIQETMFSFVKYYKNKPCSDWRPLFYRVLQNKINDHHRKVKGWLRHFFAGDDYPEPADDNNPNPSPAAVFELNSQGNEMIAIIKQLPPKQQQVLMYRMWQEMTVAETAKIMNISHGSVKTHMHRATQKIRQTIGNEDENRRSN